NVLLGARLNQRVVADGAVGVDAAAADADPIRRVGVLAGGVLRSGGHRPVASDRVELRAALLQRALVVAEPVVALVGVGMEPRPDDVDRVAVGAGGGAGR